MKKTIKIFLAAALMTAMFTNCKKEAGPAGPAGAQGAQGPAGTPGPDAKTFNFSLTFTPGETFDFYNGITGYDTQDVLLFYVHYETLGTTMYWTPLPVVAGNVNIVPEFSETTGSVIINTLKADGTSGSPWTATTLLAFKAVLIKSSIRQANPNVNLNDYEAVKKAYQLKD